MRAVGATFGINSGESLAAVELSMYLSPSRVPRGLVPEAGIDDPLRDSSVLLGKKNLGTEEGRGLGMDKNKLLSAGMVPGKAMKGSSERGQVPRRLRASARTSRI